MYIFFSIPCWAIVAVVIIILGLIYGFGEVLIAIFVFFKNYMLIVAIPLMLIAIIGAKLNDKEVSLTAIPMGSTLLSMYIIAATQTFEESIGMGEMIGLVIDAIVILGLFLLGVFLSILNIFYDDEGASFFMSMAPSVILFFLMFKSF